MQGKCCVHISQVGSIKMTMGAGGSGNTVMSQRIANLQQLVVCMKSNLGSDGVENEGMAAVWNGVDQVSIAETMLHSIEQVLHADLKRRRRRCKNGGTEEDSKQMQRALELLQDLRDDVASACLAVNSRIDRLQGNSDANRNLPRAHDTGARLQPFDINIDALDLTDLTDDDDEQEDQVPPAASAAFTPDSPLASVKKRLLSPKQLEVQEVVASHNHVQALIAQHTAEPSSSNSRRRSDAKRRRPNADTSPPPNAKTSNPPCTEWETRLAWTLLLLVVVATCFCGVAVGVIFSVQILSVRIVLKAAAAHPWWKEGSFALPPGYVTKTCSTQPSGYVTKTSFSSSSAAAVATSGNNVRRKKKLRR